MRLLQSAAIVLFVCTSAFVSPNTWADVFTNDDVITDPDPDHFSVCDNYGCATVVTAQLDTSQWLWFQNLFNPPSLTPERERKRIVWAIGLMEKIVGKLTGTSGDKGGDLEGLGLPGQMDCIDESTNTTTYLTLLAKAGLLKWHTVQDRSTRGWFLHGWPHTTAVIRDTLDNQLYAVDSWFLDNGEPPFIIPLEVWRSGWSPTKPVATSPLPTPPQTP